MDKLERLGSAVDYEWKHYEQAMNYLPDAPYFLAVAGDIALRRQYGSRRHLMRKDVKEESVCVAILAWGACHESVRDNLLEGFGERAWPGAGWSHTN